MKKILVPTDFSDLSNAALDYALQLAKSIHAEIYVVHFMKFPLDVELKVSGDTQLDTSDADLYNIQLMKSNQARIKSINEKYQGENIKVSAEIAGGGFLNGIVHFIEKRHVDLVVMGTTGEESIQEFFTGNHAEQLIERLRTPIITLREPADIKESKSIVLGFELHRELYQPWKMLELTKQILSGFQARVHLVNIVPYGYAFAEPLRLKLGEIAQELELENYDVAAIEHQDEFNGLMEFADDKNAGLIGVFSESVPGLSRFFQSTFSSDMTKMASVPVLVINRRNIREELVD